MSRVPRAALCDHVTDYLTGPSGGGSAGCEGLRLGGLGMVRGLGISATLGSAKEEEFKRIVSIRMFHVFSNRSDEVKMKGVLPQVHSFSI